MQIVVMNQEFSAIAIVDSYISMIWTDRFWEEGDFELYLPMSTEALTYLVPGYYIEISESDRTMIIESVQSTTDVDEGDKLIVKGHSLETILKRRVVWPVKQYSNAAASTIIFELIDNNFINPTYLPDARKMDILSTQTGVNISKQVTKEYTGDIVYTVVQELCEENKTGFKVIRTDENGFVFSLYRGTDRSYNQSENSYVTFSPGYDNIITSEYTHDISEYKNVAMVAKDSNITEVGTDTGFERRELYVTSSGDGEDSTQIGTDELKKCKVKKEFTGEMDTSRMFVYGTDFTLGDIVQVEDAYGQSGAARVTEMIFSEDENGISNYPTFTIVTDDEYETEDG